MADRGRPAHVAGDGGDGSHCGLKPTSFIQFWENWAVSEGAGSGWADLIAVGGPENADAAGSAAAAAG